MCVCNKTKTDCAPSPSRTSGSHARQHWFIFLFKSYIDMIHMQNSISLVSVTRKCTVSHINLLTAEDRSCSVGIMS